MKTIYPCLSFSPSGRLMAHSALIQPVCVLRDGGAGRSPGTGNIEDGEPQRLQVLLVFLTKTQNIVCLLCFMTTKSKYLIRAKNKKRPG